ncbi:hypothetical protein EUTSA_v10017879mg [Eutrema salsugineum]|uniref:Uncharacterized protein n=1 Tax=Eutrema salsugineum TaxID=72664 RepID=V4NXB0_EUTSA|nr:hypothetical protein EUTSA_v10017879mg [Eutrema salsugineum]
MADVIHDNINDLRKTDIHSDCAYENKGCDVGRYLRRKHSCPLADVDNIFGFNVSLQDPNLLKTLKVQLQLIGAPMQEKSVVATLHHQIVYRIQDHALDLVLPSSDEALYLEVTSASQAPNSIQIPSQISREELLRRLPESWITSYEKLHQAVQTPIQSSEVSFHSRNDGTTEIKFEKPRSSSFRKQLKRAI